MTVACLSSTIVNAQTQGWGQCSQTVENKDMKYHMALTMTSSGFMLHYALHTVLIDEATSCCYAFVFFYSVTRLKISQLDVFIWTDRQIEAWKLCMGVGGERGCSWICLMCVFVFELIERERKRVDSYFLDTLKRKELPLWPHLQYSLTEKSLHMCTRACWNTGSPLPVWL